MTPLWRYGPDDAGDPEFERLWPPLKGISIKKNYIGKLCHPIAITITQKIKRRFQISDFKVDARVSGA
jgi:hypothetical protein